MQNTRTNNLRHALAPNPAAACKTVTISNTAGTLETLGTFTFDEATNYVLVTIEAQPVRRDPSGTAPSTTVGQPMIAAQEALISIREAKLTQWIKSGATDAKAQVSQYL